MTTEIAHRQLPKAANGLTLPLSRSPDWRASAGRSIDRADWDFDYSQYRVRIPLTRGLWALIDMGDLDIVRGKTWHAHVCKGGTYARTWVRDANGKRVGLLLHKAITGWPMTDHVDGDGLNNARSNLRPASRAQNNRNSRVQKNNKTGLKGVSPMRSGRWRARIAVDGKQMALGAYDSPEAAHQAYRDASEKLHGGFGRSE